MAKRRLKKNEDIAILSLGGVDYLDICPPDPKPVYILFPGANQVHPSVELYTMTQEEIVNLDDDRYIECGNGVTHRGLISPRPKNIVRR
jgi:hypothetical protein